MIALMPFFCWVNKESMCDVAAKPHTNAQKLRWDCTKLWKIWTLTWRGTISKNTPSRQSHADHESCQNWYENYNTCTYRNSIFFKGPLIFLDQSLDNIFNHVTCQSTSAFKAQCKRTILSLQREGDANDWTSNKFILQNISGLRYSKRRIDQTK